MKLEDFKNFDFVVDAVLAWVACVRAPIATSHSILSNAKDDADAIRRAGKIFITAFAIGYVLQGGIYQLYGIGLTNVSFYVTSGTFLLTTFVVAAFAIYLGFKTFKIPASFRDTAVFYTVPMSAFYPFGALLASFTLAQSLSTLKMIKASDPDFWSAVRQFSQIARAHQQDPIQQSVVIITQVIGTAISFWGISIVFCALSRRWGVDRARIFDAGSFGFIVFGSLLEIPVAFIQIMTLYSFL